MNIIWLCSWYPNTEDEFTGDFIQRQAVAVSAYAHIEVMHVVFCGRNEDAVQKVSAQLTENIYYRQKGNHLQNLLSYMDAHRRFLKAYKKHYGKPDLIHVQIPFKAGVVAVCLKFLYSIPYIVTEHYGIYNSLLDDEYASRSKGFKFFTKLVVRNAEMLTTVSRSLGEDMNMLVTRKMYTVVSNVVDTSLFNYSAPPADKEFRFIHISNMIPLKNIQGIIETAEMLWAQRQDFSVTIVGDIKQTYYELAESKGLLNQVIFFKGVVPYRQIAEEIAASHALIIFSDTESQSCVVLESLCSGRPAIVTNIGGVKELVHDGNGYKVNVRDNNDLLQKMNSMINRYETFDTDEISRDAISKYSYDAVGRQFHEIYVKVTS